MKPIIREPILGGTVHVIGSFNADAHACYTLIGCRPGERRVIERTEEDFNTRAHDTAAANDWLRSALPWEARMRTDQIFVRTSEEAAQHSRNRAVVWMHR